MAPCTQCPNDAKFTPNAILSPSPYPLTPKSRFAGYPPNWSVASSRMTRVKRSMSPEECRREILIGDGLMMF